MYARTVAAWRRWIVTMLSGLSVTAALVTSAPALAHPDQDPGTPSSPVAEAPPAAPIPADPLAGVVPPAADPVAPSPTDPSAVTPASSTPPAGVAGQNPEPFTGTPP